MSCIFDVASIGFEASRPTSSRKLRRRYLVVAVSQNRGFGGIVAGVYAGDSSVGLVVVGAVGAGGAGGGDGPSG